MLPLQPCKLVVVIGFTSLCSLISFQFRLLNNAQFSVNWFSKRLAADMFNIIQKHLDTLGKLHEKLGFNAVYTPSRHFSFAGLPEFRLIETLNTTEEERMI